MPARLHDRWAVITHRRAGKSPATIKRITGFTWNFISRWCKAADEGRTGDDKTHTGRRSMVTSGARKSIKRKMEGKTKQSTRGVATQVGLSHETVRKTARQLGLKPYHQSMKPLLSAVHKRRRLAFAKQYRDHQWNRTMMSDEKRFYLFASGNRKNDVVWARNASAVPTKPRVGKSPSIHVWGGITRYGKTPLVKIEGNLNAAGYQSILNDTMLPAAKQLFGSDAWWFQQDGSPVHTAQSTQQWLTKKKLKFIPKAEWPANSPDANSIENLWAILDDKVRARRPRSIDALWRIVREEWNAIPLSTIENLIESQPARLAAIRSARGGHTKY